MKSLFTKVNMKLLIVLIPFIAIKSFGFKGNVYELESARKKLIYSIERTESVEGTQQKLILKHIGTDGKLAVEEMATSEADKLKTYSVVYPLQNEKGLIEITDKEIIFKYTKEGKEETAKEKMVDNFVVGLTMKNFVVKNWDSLQNGKTASLRMGVPDRLETVGFSLFRVKDMEKTEGVMALKLKPSSFIIAALVNPIYFEYDTKTKNLVSFKGRVRPRQFVKDKWKNLDAETVYTWE